MIDARDEVGVPSDWGIRFLARTDGALGITFDFVATPEPDEVATRTSTVGLIPDQRCLHPPHRELTRRTT